MWNLHAKGSSRRHFIADGLHSSGHDVIVEAASGQDEQRPIDLGSPIQTAQTIDAAFGQEEGVNVIYTTTSGSASGNAPAIFNVIDLDNERLLRSFPLPGSSSSWSHIIIPDGRVFIGASAKMFMYSPASQTMTDLGIPIAGTESIWALTSDERGNVYGGIYSQALGGRVFRIDAATLEMKDLLGGPVDDGISCNRHGKREDYVRSICYDRGFIYAGTGSINGRVWKIGLETGDKTELRLSGPEAKAEYGGKYNSMGSAYGMTVVRRYLFVFFNGPSVLLVYDLDKSEWHNKVMTNVRGLFAVTPEHNGKVYTAKKDGFLYEIDLDTLDETRSLPFADSLRGSAWLQSAQPSEFSEPVLVTITYDGRAAMLDPAGGKSEKTCILAKKQAIHLQSLESGPDGKLYISGYMGSLGAQYDPTTGMFVHFPLGQAEGMGALGGKMYFGIYPHAEMAIWDTSQSLSPGQGPAHLFAISAEQDRPFVITSGGGKLFVGTVPFYGQHGGALVIYDPAESDQAGEPVFHSFRHVVENQSIAGLAYKEGKLYGSTTIYGGLGNEPVASRAKLFVWDVAGAQKLTEFDLELDGLDPLPMISGLSVGPTDGLIWGAANGSLFALDPDSLRIVKHKNIYPEARNRGKWRPIYIRWGKNGWLYTNIAEQLTVVHPQTMSHKQLGFSTSLFTLDPEDHLYFTQASKLMKLAKLTPFRGAQS